MKNKILLFWGCMASVWGAVSCSYEDKSSLDDNKLTDIVIDTAGIPVKHVITRLDTLVIKPGVLREGIKPEDFEYEWRLNLLPSNNELYRVVGKEKNLSTVIDLIPDANTYRLWYRVTDKTTGLVKGIVWQVEVEASSGQGLVVVHSDDGQSSDFSLIQSEAFTADYGEGELPSYKHGLYSARNGKKLKGIVTNMFFQKMYQEQRLTNYMHGCTKNSLFIINTLDYELYAEGNEVVYDPFVKFNVDNNVLCGSSYPILVNNGKISSRSGSRQTDTEMRRYGLEVPGNYVANDKISYTSGYLGFYDEVNGKFWQTSGYLDTKNPMPSFTYQSGDAFDPNNQPGFKVLAGGRGSNSYHTFVLTKNNEYFIYIFNQKTPRALYDISAAPDIASAVDFVIPDNQNVLYYATANNVYAVRFGGTTVLYEPVYPSSEPITRLKMLRRATKSLALHENALLAITYSGGQGKVVLLPIMNLGIGNIDLSKVVIYPGFKEISAVAIQD